MTLGPYSPVISFSQALSRKIIRSLIPTGEPKETYSREVTCWYQNSVGIHVQPLFRWFQLLNVVAKSCGQNQESCSSFAPFILQGFSIRIYIYIYICIYIYYNIAMGQHPVPPVFIPIQPLKSVLKWVVNSPTNQNGIPKRF